MTKWILLLLISTSSYALDFSSIPESPRNSPLKLKYSGLLAPQDLSLHEENLSLSIPVFRGEADSFTVNLKGSWLDFYGTEPAPLNDLYRLELGSTFSHRLEDEKFWALQASIGSASDKLFEDFDVTTIELTAYYSFKDGDHSRWMLLLHYSDNRPILNNIPLPGFAYMYFPSKEFRGTFGIPFAIIRWEFVEDWHLNFSTVIPWIMKMDFEYAFSDDWNARLGIDLSENSFMIADRTNAKERLFLEERKIFLASGYKFSSDFGAQLEGGYLFDRSFFSAESYTLNPDSSYDMGKSGYVKLTLNLDINI